MASKIPAGRACCRFAVLLSAVCLLPPIAGAGPVMLSYTGTLAGPRSDFEASFTLTAADTVTIRTFGFGGGTNAAGSAIPAGGFDPLIALFTGPPATATIYVDGSGNPLADADNLFNAPWSLAGNCPPAGTVAIGTQQDCGDVIMQVALPAGTYALVLTDANYIPDAVYDNGALSEGFTDWTGGVFQTCDPVADACIAPNGQYAVDIVSNNADLSQASQSIAFAPLSDQPLAASPIMVAATATSGLAVTITSNTPGVCTVAGDVVTLLTSGGCSLTASRAGNATYAAAQPVTQDFTVLFNDISPSASYAAAVDLLAQYGITAGCGDDDFCANGLVTRAEMAVFIIAGIFGNANFNYSPTPHFADVPASGPASFGFRFIQAMYELGITGGCAKAVPPANLPTFCPNQSVNREEMAVFIMVARFGGASFNYSSTPSFADVPDSGATANYFKFVQRMKQDGITGGCAKAVAPATLPTFCPDEAVSRAQMAVFMMVGLFNQLLPAGTPVISQISPSNLAVGGSGTYTITGMNTNFVQGTTTLAPIPGVSIGPITVNSPTSLTVQLTAASNAAAQPRSLDAITGTEEAVLPNGLTVQ